MHAKRVRCCLDSALSSSASFMRAWVCMRTASPVCSVHLRVHPDPRRSCLRRVGESIRTVIPNTWSTCNKLALIFFPPTPSKKAQLQRSCPETALWFFVTISFRSDILTQFLPPLQG
jgi:hypothetical protein